MSYLPKNKKDRSDLGKLYPVPKSYDELLSAREETEKLHAKHVPKRIILSTNLRLYSVLVGLALVITTTFSAISFNIISGIFFGFFIGLVWFGYTVWTVVRISEIFQIRELTATPIFILYACILPAAGVLSYKLTAHTSLILFFVAITAIHFILVYLLTQFILSKKLKS